MRDLEVQRKLWEREDVVGLNKVDKEDELGRRDWMELLFEDY